MRDSREQIGRCRSNKHLVGPAREFDMAHRSLGGFVPQAGSHRIARQRLEGRRADKAGGIGGHHHANLGARITQPAHKLGRLVGGYSAADPKQDTDAIEWSNAHVGNF